MRTEWGGGMVIRNGGSKNSTSPPYLVKNERSLSRINNVKHRGEERNKELSMGGVCMLTGTLSSINSVKSRRERPYFLYSIK